MVTSGHLAAGRRPKVPQRIYWRIDHLFTSDLDSFLDKVLTQQGDQQKEKAQDSSDEYAADGRSVG